MNEVKFKPGDKVMFNMQSENGPIGKGTVTRVYGNGTFLISPEANIGSGIRFFNIKKDDSK
jgi:hypothetical protein